MTNTLISNFADVSNVRGEAEKKSNDFLFELGCEELPSGEVWPLAEALAKALEVSLNQNQMHFNTIRAFATPRRLAVLVSDLQEEQPNQTVSKRGPAVQAAYDKTGQPTPALLGFAKSCGVDIKDLSTSKTDKGEWIIYETQVNGQKTTEWLPPLIEKLLQQLPIKKPMRWGGCSIEFARPIHWIVMLFGQTLIPAHILGIKAGRDSYGHRYHHPEAIPITTAQSYEAQLANAFVIPDFQQRRSIIAEQVTALAKGHDAHALMPSQLLDEVTSIVEWPEALCAEFEPEFLDIPSEALIASMQLHQKCFAMQSKQGHLLPRFITVANIQSLNPNQVILGNQKVMRARLKDAAFFYHQDRKHRLIDRVSLIENVIFQKKLGTLGEKVKRISALMSRLSDWLHLPLADALRAVQLCKCDLMSGMVGEFPELQGIMGYYYARHDGEPMDIAIALKEQYLPRFSGDELPASSLGLALSLADRLDTLVGIFAIGQKPTGVKDPFKLRRHALAIARLLITTENIGLTTLIDAGYQAYGKPFAVKDNLYQELKTFIFERLQSHYQSQGYRIDLFEAVRAVQDECLHDFDQRIQALRDFTKKPEARSLASVCKRVNHLLHQKEIVDSTEDLIDESLLTEGAENALYFHLKTLEQRLNPFYDSGDYPSILVELASLQEPVDAFFESVMVMVEDQTLKNNRLQLLSKLQTMLKRVADISLLQLTL